MEREIQAFIQELRRRSTEPGYSGPYLIETTLAYIAASTTLDEAKAKAKAVGIDAEQVDDAAEASEAATTDSAVDAPGSPPSSPPPSVPTPGLDPAAAAAENVAATGGYAFARDGAGNIVMDLMGNPVLADGVTALVVDPNTGEPLFEQPAVFSEPQGPIYIGFGEEDPRDSRTQYRVADESAPIRRGSKATQGSGRLRGVIHSPTYHENDQWSDFSTKAPEYLTEVQRMLLAAGLLKEDEVVEGVWTYESALAMKQLMWESNATGGTRKWQDILRARVEARAGDEEDTAKSRLASRFLTLPPRQIPDYSSLSMSVKDLFRNQLGRDPLDWEVALLADQLNTDYRSAYESEIAAITQEFEAGNRAIIRQEEMDEAGPVIEGSGSVQMVDPVARLRQRFEEKYAPEIDLNQDRAADRQQLANVFSILTQTSNLMSGGLS